MARFSKEEQRQASANLRRWSERPVGKTNALVLGLSAIVIVMMLVGARHAPNPVGFVRDVAVAFFICQGVLHFVSIGALQTLVRLGVPESDNALAAYRDPQRLSNLDMPMMWALIALAVPLLW